MAKLETESQGIEIQVHNSAQGDEQLVQDPVVICINGMFEKLSPVSPDRCIYRVHQPLRQLKPQAYTPQVVSIGPLHHGYPSLKAMEEHKLRYLHNFLDMFKLSLTDCVKVTRDMEKRARDCYADRTSYITSDEFVNMLLVDGAFIIMLLLNNIGQQNSDDYIYYRPRLLRQVINDIILLENQLPFFVVEGLCNKLTLASDPVQGPTYDPLLVSFHSLLFKYNYLRDEKPKPISGTEVKHFTDFLRTCLKPTPKMASPRRENIPYGSIPNAEKLYEAGVKFKKSSSKCIVDIQYKDGELQIPHFNVGDMAESFYRNLIAFELCHYITDTYVIDCLRLMDGLINTPRDVDLLVQAEIIYNRLGDNHAVAHRAGEPAAKKSKILKREPYASKRCGCGFRIRAIVPIANYNEKDKTFVYQEEGIAVFKLYAVHSGHEPGPLDGNARIMHRVVGHKGGFLMDQDTVYGFTEDVENEGFEFLEKNEVDLQHSVLQQVQDLKAEVGLLEGKIMRFPPKLLGSVSRQLFDIMNKLRSIGDDSSKSVELLPNKQNSDDVLVGESDLAQWNDHHYEDGKEPNLVEDDEDSFGQTLGIIVPWDQTECRSEKHLMSEDCKSEKWLKCGEFDEKSILDSEDSKLIKPITHDRTLQTDVDIVGIPVDSFYQENPKWYDSPCGLDSSADCGDSGFRHGEIV